METKENVVPINGQGIRLVKQAEGLDIPLLQPWEVEGERELIRKGFLTQFNIIEENLSKIYKHIQTCQNPTCDAEKSFNKVMKFRREYCFPLLKEKELALYESLYALIAIYLLSHGNENLYMEAVYLGLSISIDMVSEAKRK